MAMEKTASGTNIRIYNALPSSKDGRLAGQVNSALLDEDVIDELSAALAKGTPLGLFLINISAFSLFQKLYGRASGEQIMERLEQIVRQVSHDILPTGCHSLVEKIDHSSVILLYHNGPMVLDSLMDRALSLRSAVRSLLNREVVSLTGQNLPVEVGCAMVPGGSAQNLEAQLYNALSDARQVAEGTLDTKRLSLMAEFRQLVECPQLTAVYQPIINLSSGDPLGWESLARGPESGYFHMPKMMFDFAEEVGSLFHLEKACREEAIKGLGPLGPGQKLFLNIHPQTLGDPDFRPGETRRLLDRYGLKPSNVVFEITERHSITDFTLFHRTLDHYRSQGFLVAIDDVGTGYSGLNRIARLRPDFLKIDMSLVRGVDTNPVQRAILETLVTFANKIGCSIIAEGIETATEFSSLVNMGVHFGQGFHLAMPANPKPQPKISLPTRNDLTKDVSTWKCSIPVRQLVDFAPQVRPDALVKDVKTIVESHPISGVVVSKDQLPVGLVMSHALDRQLGTLYGIALYYDRGICSVMDDCPLVVEGNTPVEYVAKKAMSRERFKIYDHIIVTEDGRTSGVVSVQKMLDALARVQVEMAKGANPLTGLPGNVALETEIERRLENLEGGISIIYADLDNFKAYNDSYGFESGDRMIRLMSDVLQWAGKRHGGGDHYLGHIGGDDFVLITSIERAERACRGILRAFKRIVRGLYNARDVERGYIVSKGRDGRRANFPLVSVSLGIVDCVGRTTLDEISQRAAEMKNYAKSQPGNVYVRDRRKPLGDADDTPGDDGADLSPTCPETVAA